MEIRDKNLLPAPQKMRTPPEKRDQRKYCDYHRDHGHSTNDCYQLKRAIEALIRKGVVSRQYLAGEPEL